MKSVYLAALLAVTAAPLEAQGVAGIRLSPYAGYIAFGDYLEGPADVVFSNDNGALYGAQLSVRLVPLVSLYGNVAYSQSRWSFEDVPFVGNLSLGDAGVLLYDGGVHVALPFGSLTSVAPFVQVGVGAIRYSLNDNLLTRVLDRRSATNFAVNGGVGVDFQFLPVLGMRLMVKDYLASFSSNRIQDSRVGEILRLEGKWAHTLALSAGVTIGF